MVLDGRKNVLCESAVKHLVDLIPLQCRPPRLLVHVEQRMEQSWEPTESHTYVAAKGNLQLGGAYRGCLLSLGKKVAWWFCYKTRYYDDGMWLGHTSTPTGSVFTFYTSPISILVLPSNILTNQPVAFVLASRARLYGRHFCLFLCYRGNCKVLESPTPSCNIKVSSVDSLS